MERATRALPASTPTLLRNALVPRTDGDGYKRLDVLIKNGHLEQIAAGHTLQAPDGGRAIDCTERMLLPGFFNGHTHSVEYGALHCAAG
jgi:cytosine/adenosine deaminase-related metal-dependent hydrolase